MSNECSDFDITEALSEEEQAELLAQGSKQEPVCPYPDFTVDKGGKTHLQATYANFEAMCRMQGISVQKDIIRRTYRIPPDIATRFSMDGAVDAFCVELQDRCTREGIRTNDKQVQKWMKTAADAHRVNPVRQYLEQQFKRYPIPPEQRGATVMDVFSCLEFGEDVTDKQQENYCNLFSKWLVQCVAMAHNEQGKYGADFVLVLQSKKQGAGKTSFFRQLCSPKQLRDYFLEGCSMDPSNKDDVLQNTSCWICELGELEGTTRKKDVDRLKAFLTNKSDRVRAPYAVAACDYPRLTCYAGTVNEPDFLREAGRRFVVLPIVGVDLSRLKKIDMNRLWAEVYAAYLENPNNFRLTREELQGVIADSEQFRTVFSEEQLIRDLLDWDSDPDTWQERTAGEIALMLEIKNASSVGKALRNMGYEKTRDPDNPRRYRMLKGSTKYHIPARKFISYDVDSVRGAAE